MKQKIRRNGGSKKFFEVEQGRGGGLK